jgi:hypothetical protein
MPISDPVSQHGHKPNGAAGEAVCPYCGQAISRKAFQKIRSRIEQEERARIAKVEQALRARFATEQQQAAAKAKAEIEKAKKEAVVSATAQMKALRASQEATIAQRVQAAREAAEKKLSAAIAAERTKAYEERMKLDARLADLQRQLQRRTADELGREGEIDLFSVLSAEFGGIDKLARVPRGRNGADIIHDVVHNGAVVGRIIFDSKNHRRWQLSFTTKLRLDMVHHNADHGVLSSSVFPAGARQLHMQDGVIVAAPPRIVVLAHLLRRQITQLHAHRLSNEARDEKRDRLYDFITSDRCTQLLDRIGTLSSDVLDLDMKEESSHRTVWKRRAELIRAIQGVQHEVTSEIDQIVTGSEAESRR